MDFFNWKFFDFTFRVTNGVKKIEDNLFMPYKSIFQDVRDAFDWVHGQVSLTTFNYPIVTFKNE